MINIPLLPCKSSLLTVDDKVVTLTRSQLLLTSRKAARHRLDNDHDGLVEIIEVQFGDYLGEDDIVRYDDAYNRA